MIHLAEEHYAAIGHVAVQSGTLEREVGEYITRLGASRKPPARSLGPKLTRLRKELKIHPDASVAFAEFEFTINAIEALVRKRNAVVHGVWSSASNAPLSLGDTEAKGHVTVQARDILSVAKELRLARKLLLRLMHDYCPSIAGGKKCPKSLASDLKKKL